MFGSQSDIDSYQDELLSALDPLLVESNKLVGGHHLGDKEKRPHSNYKGSISNSNFTSQKLWRSGSANTISSQNISGGLREKYSLPLSKHARLPYPSGAKSVLPVTNASRSDILNFDENPSKSSETRRSTTSLYAANSRYASKYEDDDPSSTKPPVQSIARTGHNNSLKSSNNEFSRFSSQLRIPNAKNRASITKSRIRELSWRSEADFTDRECADKNMCLVTREYIDDLINKLAATSMIDIGCNTWPLGASFRPEITDKEITEMLSQKDLLSKELKRERERVMASEQALDNLRNELSSKSNEAQSLRQTCSQQENHLEELEKSVKRLVMEVANKEEETEDILGKLRQDCENLETDLDKTLGEKRETEKRETLCRKKHEEITKRFANQIKQLEKDLTSSRLGEQNLRSQLEKLQDQYAQLEAAKKEEKAHWYNQVSQWEAHNKTEQSEKRSLCQKLEELEKMNVNLENSISKLHQAYNADVNTLQIEMNNKEKQCSYENKELESQLKIKFTEKLTKRVNELKSSHSSQIQEITEQANQQLRYEVETMAQQHAQEVGRLNEELEQMKIYIQQSEEERNKLYQEKSVLEEERWKLLESMKSMMSVYCQEALQFLSRPVDCPTENLISLNTPRSVIDECGDHTDLFSMESNSCYSKQLSDQLASLWPANSSNSG